MIIIKVEVSVHNSKISDFEQRVSQITNSALLLDGCMDYLWFRHQLKSNSYFIYGEFLDMDAFKAYKASEVVEKIVRWLIPLAADKPKYRHFEAIVFEES